MIDPATVDWLVYVIVDPAAISEHSPEEVAIAAIDGGAGVIQLRDKLSTARETFELARRLAVICTERSVPFIVNDRLDIALAAGADGVHVGPDDLPVSEIRRVAPELLVGGSAGTPEAARALVAQGAHYLGSGAVYDASGSKPDAHHHRGLDALRDVVEAVDVPVVGIGGIDASNARAVIDAGASGVAVIRAVCATPSPRDATIVLREFVS